MSKKVKCTICGDPEKYRLKLDMDMHGIPICEKEECEDEARMRIMIEVMEAQRKYEDKDEDN